MTTGLLISFERLIKNGTGICLMYLLVTACSGMENPGCQSPDNEKEGHFLTVRDGMEIFISEFVPTGEIRNTIYIISGITGINPDNEKDIITLFSRNGNRIVVIHPRGTGYSEGSRGDTDPEEIIADYCEIIKRDNAYQSDNEKIFLYGHSMSCAFALEAAGKLPGADGLILVNPPYKLKPAKGMSPGLLAYLKYAGYFVFSPHTPVVNMAGDPSLITDEQDRAESEQRNSDSLLVKYFSMRCMGKTKKIMDRMGENAGEADLPLLLLYGEKDNIVDKSGCDEIFSMWKDINKSYAIIKDGSHGKSTVLKGSEVITKWIDSVTKSSAFLK